MLFHLSPIGTLLSSTCTSFPGRGDIHRPLSGYFIFVLRRVRIRKWKMDSYLRMRMLSMGGETCIDLCTFLYLFQRGESGPAKFSLAEKRKKTNHRRRRYRCNRRRRARVIETSREQSMLRTFRCQLRFAVSRILSSSFPFVSVSIRFLWFPRSRALRIRVSCAWIANMWVRSFRSRKDFPKRCDEEPINRILMTSLIYGSRSASKCSFVTE